MSGSQMLEYEIKLKKLREELDLLDEEVVRLLLRRFVLTQEVGKTKMDFNIPILDQNREMLLLDKIEDLISKQLDNNSISKINDLQSAIRNIYETLLIQSKELQAKIDINL